MLDKSPEPGGCFTENSTPTPRAGPMAGFYPECWCPGWKNHTQPWFKNLNCGATYRRVEVSILFPTREGETGAFGSDTVRDARPALRRGEKGELQLPTFCAYPDVHPTRQQPAMTARRQAAMSRSPLLLSRSSARWNKYILSSIIEVW